MIEKGFIKVIDNFLSKVTFKRIKDQILAYEFNWGYSEMDYNPDLERVTGKPVPENVGVPMYVHSLYGSGQVLSPFFPVFLPIYDRLKEEFGDDYGGLIKSKINAYANHGKRRNLAKHNDLYFQPDLLRGETHIKEEDKLYVTSVLQFTTDNGATCIGDKEFSNKENRIVMFDGALEHWAYTQTDIERRIIMNINFRQGRQIIQYPW